MFPGIFWKNFHSIDFKPCQGCHTSGKSRGKFYFFKVGELSGNLKNCQGNSEKGQMSGNFMLWFWKACHIMTFMHKITWFSNGKLNFLSSRLSVSHENWYTNSHFHLDVNEKHWSILWKQYVYTKVYIVQCGYHGRLCGKWELNHIVLCWND